MGCSAWKAHSVTGTTATRCCMRCYNFTHQIYLKVCSLLLTPSFLPRLTDFSFLNSSDSSLCLRMMRSLTSGIDTSMGVRCL